MAKKIEELNAELKKLNSNLGKSAKSLKNFKGEAENTADSVGKVQAAAKSTGRSFQDSKEQLEGFGASMRAVGGNIGPLEDMATAFEKLGPAGVVAAAGVAALVAGAYAVARFAQVTIEATRAAGELLDEWDRPEIFAEQAVAIDEANRALDDLVTSGQMLQVIFAAGMSPAVVETARAVAALAMALQEAVEVADEWGVTLESVWSGLVATRGEFQVLAGTVGLLNHRYSDQVDELFNLSAALRDAAAAREEEAAAAEANFKGKESNTKANLIALERQKREEERARKEKARKEEKARQDAKAANNKAAEDKRAEEEKAAEEAQRLLDEQTDAAEKAAEAEARAVEEALALAKAAREDAAYATLGLMDAVLAAEQNRFDTETAEGRRAAKSIYQARRAVAIAEVALSSVVAMQNAAALPWPANIPAVVAAGVTSAANAVAVAAVPPPSFPIGGLVPSDHQLIGAQAGEGILSTAAVRALGEEQVGAMNRGTAGGAPIEVAMVYRHRVFDRFVQDNLRRSDSPLASAIQGARRKRKRRR